MGQAQYEDETTAAPAVTPPSEPLAPEPEPNRPGAIAYTRYCDLREWKAFNGDKLPDFEELRKTKPEIAASWDAAAMAVLQAANGIEHVPSGDLPSVAGSFTLTPEEMAHRARVLLREAIDGLASPDVVQFLCDVIRMTKPDRLVHQAYLPKGTFKTGDSVEHVRTGGHYGIVYSPEDGLFIEATGEPAYLYLAHGSGKTTYWVRPAREMEDGRFVKVPSPTQP